MRERLITIEAPHLVRQDKRVLQEKRMEGVRMNIQTILDDVADELGRAMEWPAMNSAHEGYGVLAEEVDELWDHVKVRQDKRDLVAMRKEAIQVAAMAIRFVYDVCDGERGRK